MESDVCIEMCGLWVMFSILCMYRWVWIAECGEHLFLFHHLHSKFFHLNKSSEQWLQYFDRRRLRTRVLLALTFKVFWPNNPCNTKYDRYKIQFFCWVTLSEILFENIVQFGIERDMDAGTGTSSNFLIAILNEYGCGWIYYIKFISSQGS